MASGFFALLDDIGALMDDVAMASKIATKKTAGILGDDLAVNAEKATGFLSSRELPVLWKITKGSLLNKLIIVPLIFLLQFLWPQAITFILLIGGFYLAYEGVEKIVEWLFHRQKTGKEVIEETQNNVSDAITAEKIKVRSAISTDFILSLEIVIIALSSVLHQSLSLQIMTVSVVALLATVGVYGIVALIVRMDDAGFKLIRKSKGNKVMVQLGRWLVIALPGIIKLLSVVGTIALLLVSGGIIAHNIEAMHHFIPNWPATLRELIFGIIAGVVIVIIMTVFKKLWAMRPASKK